MSIENIFEFFQIKKIIEKKIVVGNDKIMTISWNVENELTNYVLKHDNVSAECRLTVQEELALFELFFIKIIFYFIK